MSEMREFLNDGRIRLVLGPICHWRMAATDDRLEQGFVRGKTRWATSSSKLATLLAREHAGETRQSSNERPTQINGVGDESRRRMRHEEQMYDLILRRKPVIKRLQCE